MFDIFRWHLLRLNLLFRLFCRLLLCFTDPVRENLFRAKDPNVVFTIWRVAGITRRRIIRNIVFDETQHIAFIEPRRLRTIMFIKLRLFEASKHTDLLPTIPHFPNFITWLSFPYRPNDIIAVLKILFQILDDGLLKEQQFIFLFEFLLNKLQSLLCSNAVCTFALV